MCVCACFIHSDNCAVSVSVQLQDPVDLCQLCLHACVSPRRASNSALETPRERPLWEPTTAMAVALASCVETAGICGCRPTAAKAKQKDDFGNERYILHGYFISILSMIHYIYIYMYIDMQSFHIILHIYNYI